MGPETGRQPPPRTGAKQGGRGLTATAGALCYDVIERGRCQRKLEKLHGVQMRKLLLLLAVIGFIAAVYFSRKARRREAPDNLRKIA